MKPHPAKRGKKPAKRQKTWIRTYQSDPWNDPRVRLELFIAPNLALKLGLPRHIAEKPEDQK